MKVPIPGINASGQEIVQRILSDSDAVSEAILFGSRAKGNYQQGSDIDIAIKGEDANLNTISSLSAAFEESSLIYFVDVILYSNITNPDLKSHIDRVGKTLFKREK